MICEVNGVALWNKPVKKNPDPNFPFETLCLSISAPILFNVYKIRMKKEQYEQYDWEFKHQAIP